MATMATSKTKTKTKTVYPLGEYLAKRRVSPVADPASDKALHKVVDGGIAKKTPASSLKQSQKDLYASIQRHEAAEHLEVTEPILTADGPAATKVVKSDDCQPTRSSSFVSSDASPILSNSKDRISPATSFASESSIGSDQTVKKPANPAVDKAEKPELTSIHKTQAGRVVKNSAPQQKQAAMPKALSLAVSLALGMQAGVEKLPSTAVLLGERQQAAEAQAEKASAEKESVEKALVEKASVEKVQAATRVVAARTTIISTTAVETKAASSNAIVANAEPVVGDGKLDRHRVHGGRRVLITKLCINGYRPVERIHLGNDSSIWRAEHKDTAESIAIKFPQDRFRHNREGLLNVWKRECDFHQKAARNQATHVVQLVPDMTSVDPENLNGLYLGMELMHGTCGEYLGGKDKDKNIEKDVYLLIAQVTSGLESLHRQNIVHNNLAPQNILFTRETSNWGGKREERIVWKLADFGFAAANMTFFGKGGVARWTAPDIAEMENVRMMTDTDVWPLWCLMVVFLNWGNSSKWLPSLVAKETPETLSEYRAAMVHVAKHERRARWWNDMGCNSGTGRPSAKDVMERLREHGRLEFKETVSRR